MPSCINRFLMLPDEHRFATTFHTLLMKKDLTVYRHICHLSLLIGLIWVAFGNCLVNDFAWDDYDLIINNQQIRQLSSVGDFFTRGFWNFEEGAQDQARDFFRPLVMASYALDYRLYGLNPQGFHLTNLLAHVLCAFLVYFLAMGLSKNSTIALIAAAIWAVHPTHVENVAWICGRGDILAGFFFFSSCCLFTIWIRRPKPNRLPMAALSICYALALLCKEMAITLPALLLVACLLSEDRERGFKVMALMFSALALITIGYLATRYLVLGKIAGVVPGATMGEMLITLPMVFARYIGLLLGLVHIDPHHPEGLCKTALSISFVLNLTVVLAYGALLVLAWLRRRHMLLFCLLWFPVTLAPVFRLGGFGDILYADRFLYIPSVGFILAAVFFIAMITRAKGRFVVWFALVLCCTYLAMNLGYSRVATSYWKDNLSLFSRAVKTSPDSAYIQYSLGKSLSDVEAYEEALKAYDNAIALFPRYVEAYNNKAFVLNRLARYGEAFSCSKMAMQLKSAHYSTLINTGDSFLGFGDLDTAEDFYTGSLSIRKTAIGHHQLALCLMEQGRYEGAHRHFTAALSIKQNPRILNNLGALFLRQGEPDKAIRYARAALSHLNPDIPSNIKLEIHYNMARAFLEKGVLDQAERQMKKTRALLSSGYGTLSMRTKITAWLDIPGFPCGDDKKGGL
jgi:protein O-mannosyl-transferase